MKDKTQGFLVLVLPRLCHLLQSRGAKCAVMHFLLESSSLHILQCLRAFIPPHNQTCCTAAEGGRGSLAHGQFGVAIAWAEVWGRAAEQAPESCRQSKGGLVSFRLQFWQCFRMLPICHRKVKRDGFKFPRTHLTLSKCSHLLDLPFSSAFCVSSHGQILKPEDFPGINFALSCQLSALHWNLSSVRVQWPVLASQGGCLNLCECLSAGAQSWGSAFLN